MNTIEIQGNLVRPPELRYFESGKVVLNAKIADNYNDRGEKKANFWNVTVFGETTALEQIAQEFIDGKGARVKTKGRVVVEEWETEAGEKKSIQKVLAESLEANPWVESEQKGKTEQPKKKAAPLPWEEGGDPSSVKPAGSSVKFQKANA